MTPKPDNQEMRFVVHHYRKDAFNPDKALKKWRLHTRHAPIRRWVAVAASLLCLVVVAAVVTWRVVMPDTPVKSETPAFKGSQGIMTQPTARFHFDDTPLPEVLQQLCSTYGIELKADDTEKHLTGDFDADSLDAIINMIEEVLDVKITRAEP